jgi:Flp pilus assembly protein TadD
MAHLIANFFPRAAFRCVISCLLTLTVPVLAQAPPPISPAQFDPSDVYFQGYLATRAAEELDAKGDHLGAIAKLKTAQTFFDNVARYYPDWKPDMVKSRSLKTAASITQISPKALAQREKDQNAVAELEGGVKSSGTLIDPPPSTLPSPSVLEIDPIAARRLAEAEAEVKRLRSLNSASPIPDSTASRDASRARDLTRQRDAIQAQLDAAEANAQALRARLAASPVEGEMKKLSERITAVEQERDAMNMALNQSRSDHTEALSRIAILQADLNAVQQKRADLDRDLKLQNESSAQVVSGQRAQLQALEKELAQKNVELGSANQRIAGLINELQESRDAFGQLRTERDALLQERDQMSALLKLNEDGRIQDLVQQNMGLAKNLREANEKVERLNLDSNSAKDDVLAALQDLVIAKTKINRLVQEKRDQDNRLAELEKRLKSEDSALARGQVSSDPTEVAALRDIIQHQLRVQERRRQARDLLVESVKEMGNSDPRIAQAVKLFDDQEIQLTPEEQRLIANQNVDGEFTSPFAQDRNTVARNTSDLTRDIAVFERTAEKAFAAKRYLPTRELFQMIVEQHPGHIQSLCKLGVVNLTLNDPAAAADNFRRAVELNANEPYAHRMLGYSLMLLGDLPAAEQEFKQAVELAPDDAKSQLLLATVSHRLGHLAEAEMQYKAAISADPLPSDPYFNLALLCASSKRVEKAREYYSLALERGAAPDPSLEQRLALP